MLFLSPVLTAKRGGGAERPAAFPAPASPQIIRQCPEAFVAGRGVPPPRPAHSGRAAVSFARSANSFCSVRFFAPAVFAAALRFHATPLANNKDSQTTALHYPSPYGANCSTLFLWVNGRRESERSARQFFKVLSSAEFRFPIKNKIGAGELRNA